MVAARLPGIFCLEGSWGKRLTDRTSVLPTLDSLERLRLATYIHRDVGTEEELYHYLDKWAQAGYRQYGVLFFAFHGVRGGIQVGRGTVTLDDLADRMNGKATARTVYFGSCSVMRDKPESPTSRRRREPSSCVDTPRTSTGSSRQPST